jgi:hypothetical protein
VLGHPQVSKQPGIASCFPPEKMERLYNMSHSIADRSDIESAMKHDAKSHESLLGRSRARKSECTRQHQAKAFEKTCRVVKERHAVVEYR